MSSGHRPWSAAPATRPHQGRPMFETIRGGLSELSEFFAWAPDSVVGAAILLIAAVIAVSIHRTLVRGVRRLLRDKHPYIRSFLAGTDAITRLALLVFALFVALPATPFDPDTRAVIDK